MLKNLMRGIKALCLIGLVLFGWRNYDTLAPRAVALYQTSRQGLAAVKDWAINSSKQSSGQPTNKTARASSHATNSTTQATPIESIVQKATLKKTYYYSFDHNVPKAARQVFLEAVATYNQTGLVHLVAGQASGSQNSVTFSMYYKKMTTGATRVEVGHGGPDITKETNWRGTQYWNNATASLNGSYAAAFSKSVAVHELGHALGLNHSSSTDSVMYPVSQGKSTLSSADIAALQTIYQ